MSQYGWADGVFSKELLEMRLKVLNEELKGKNIPCLDGVIRTIHSVHRADGYVTRLLINEGDPDCESGHFISVLTAQRIMTGEPLPSQFQIKHFERGVRADYPNLKDGVLVEEPPSPKKKIIVTRSGIVTPSN